MGIKMLREPSVTPNIINIDDIIGLRFAYGDKNGAVVNVGNECNYSISGSSFFIESGRLVLNGVECDIDANRIAIAVDNVSTKRYFCVYLEINLGVNSATIKSVYDTATFPTIVSGDDLTAHPTGTARLKLYQFEAVNGVISNVNVGFDKPIVKHAYWNEVSASKGYYTDNQGLDYKTFKFTFYTINNNITAINKRLDDLGFKSGSITGIANATLTKQGKYAILKIANNTQIYFGTNNSINLTMSFTSNETFGQQLSWSGDGFSASLYFYFTKGSNIIRVTGTQNGNIYEARIGFEIV